MRFVLVDEDRVLTEMVESMLAGLGHEVVGVVDNTADAVRLLHAVKPDVVIVDLSLGYNTDFDVVAAAEDVGARTVVFSFTADHAVLDRYAVRPDVVHKPDLVELERVVARLVVDSELRSVVDRERRVRPVRAAAGPPPTGLTDAQAFYTAMNEGDEGDALVSVELPTDGAGAPDSAVVAERIKEVMRETDRIFASAHTVRVFLPGAGEVGVASLLHRLDAAAALPEGARTASVVLGAGELPADAFERLRHAAHS